MTKCTEAAAREAALVGALEGLLAYVTEMALGLPSQ